ncbi:uncharacterized protein LOC134948416 isoform X2 [Pseudophryne corroboree]|uniref:uncharacterized protein LOC134948416 isoform X2 n=1 Tax=Pseudophryne corroboree TaxID=495146 RepID=UPI003081E449
MKTTDELGRKANQLRSINSSTGKEDTPGVAATFTGSLKVPQTSRPDRPQTSQDEAGIAGSASGSRPPVRRPSQGLGHLPRRPSKTRRLGSESAAPSSPPRRRLSAVSPQPPLALLASSQSDEPRSPQLSEPSLMADVDQQGQDQQATITLQLTPVDPSQPIQLQDIPQASISPQLAQAPPQPKYQMTFGPVGQANRPKAMPA